MIKHLGVLLLFSLLIGGCKVNPADPLYVNEFGKVYVTANVIGADILINNQSSGFFTPDTLTLNSGTYQLSIVKDGYLRIDDSVKIETGSFIEKNYTLQTALVAKTVLLEDFANVSCIPCVTSNNIIESLKKRYSSKDFIAIKYATNFPTPYDPFYLNNKDLMNNKMSYYNIILAPTIIIDGTIKPTPTDSLMIQNKIDEERILPADFKLEIKDTIINNIYRVDVSASLLNSNLDLSNLVIKGYLIEEQISFTTAPGQSGELEFYNVVREQFPDVQANLLIGSSTDNPYKYTAPISLKTIYNQEKLKAVFFIQDVNTKKVYQASSTF